MINNVVVNALKIINGYLNQNYSNKELLIRENYNYKLQFYSY